MTLDKLKTNKFATVQNVQCEGAIKRRLIDMGITPGVKVTVTKIAPLGDPMEISLRNYKLSLRKSEAEKINIELGE